MIRAKVDKRVWTEGNLDEEPGSQGQCIFLLVLSYHLDFLSCVVSGMMSSSLHCHGVPFYSDGNGKA